LELLLLVVVVERMLQTPQQQQQRMLLLTQLLQYKLPLQGQNVNQSLALCQLLCCISQGRS
jgi:hypothetical protein